MMKVHVYHEGRHIQSTELAIADILIGRDQTADITLDSPAVSRRHARIVWDNGQWVLSDLGAANGVFLKKEGEPAARVIIENLNVADQIMIEKFKLVFEELSPIMEEDSNQNHAGHSADEESGEVERTQFISMLEVVNAQQNKSAADLFHKDDVVVAESKVNVKTKNSVLVEDKKLIKPIEQKLPNVEQIVKSRRKNVWWVLSESIYGDKKILEFRNDQYIKVGTSEACLLRLSSGRDELLVLHRNANDMVALKRLTMWPFPRVFCDGKSFKNIELCDQDSFQVGDHEFRLYLKNDPRL